MSQTPYLGSKISLISKLDIRYEGILYTVDSNESTIALAKGKLVLFFKDNNLVRSFGTEDRPTDHPVKPRDEVYEFIIFKASDIKDLVVCETPREPEGIGGLDYDPAIVSVSQQPTAPKSNVSPKAPTPDYENKNSAAYQQPPKGSRQDGNRGPVPNKGSQGGFYNNYRNQGPRFNRNAAPKEKLKFDSDYDFEKANEKFKEQLDTLAGDLNKKVVFDADWEEKEEKNGQSTVVTEDTDCYDKSTSFFDSISCESSEKAEGRNKRPDWRKERQTNQETFGQYAVRNQYHTRGGYRGVPARGPPRYGPGAPVPPGSQGNFNRQNRPVRNAPPSNKQRT